jgi:hypothetical protein
MKRFLIFFILAAALGLLSCEPKASAPASGSEQQVTTKTMAAKKYEEMESEMNSSTFALRLDRSTIEDIVEYMGREPDSMRRASGGKLRYIGYSFDDESELVFAMKAAPEGGLVLNHIEADPID